MADPRPAITPAAGFSCGETLDLLRKAGRACDWGQGVADDFAAAVAWLLARGFAGASAALAALPARRPPRARAPVLRAGKALCGVCNVAQYGMAAMECVVAGAAKRAQWRRVGSPLLAFGIAGVCAQRHNAPLCLNFAGGAPVVVGAQGWLGKPPARAAALVVCLARAAPPPAPPPATRFNIPPAQWRLLQARAAAVYVPEARALRVHAGAGETDND